MFCSCIDRSAQVVNKFIAHDVSSYDMRVAKSLIQSRDFLKNPVVFLWETILGIYRSHGSGFYAHSVLLRMCLEEDELELTLDQVEQDLGNMQIQVGGLRSASNQSGIDGFNFWVQAYSILVGYRVFYQLLRNFISKIV